MVRYDFYQSDSKVVITVLYKNAEQKNYKVVIEPEKVIMTADDYSLELDLFRAINPEKSSYKATPSKVEISLGKIDGTRWDTLEKKKVVNPAPVVVKKKPEDWDKFAKEVEKKESEEEKGEEALQALFRKIYESSSEETKRAMNKSFQESQGTVLSTNWKEVGKQQVDVKPPDGVEFKKWDE